MRGPSPIEEETAEEMADVDLRSNGGEHEAERDEVDEKNDGEDLVRVTTWGSVIAPMSWVRRMYSQKRREEMGS